MKNATFLSLIFLCLTTSTSIFAAEGLSPKCTNGAVNLVIVNKDVSGCPGTSMNGKHTYCLYDPIYDEKHFQSHECWDCIGELFKNSNDSNSYPKDPQTASAAYLVGYYKDGKYGTESKRLIFTYNHGSVSENCAEVFGSDLSCVISESGDSTHKIYTLTISDNP